MKITVTQELLDQHPQLVELGILVGQEIESEDYGLPLEEQPQTQDGQNFADDPPNGGGGTGSDRPKNPPPRP